MWHYSRRLRASILHNILSSWMHSKNIPRKVADVKACGRAARWATLENTKPTTDTTVIKADRPSYLSWLWRLVSKHLKPTRYCGLRASHLPAVNQDASGDGRPSHKAAYVTFQEHKNKHGWDHHKALGKTWHQVLILRKELPLGLVAVCMLLFQQCNKQVNNFLFWKKHKQ